ncbi:unnamed protein product [Adineta steineri]|uniref:protein-tyrosine-phosphatase n=1 Tax=Adineta steineri TaxID=433720 RepID=A0A818YFT8_9BILA|nr:unnamed protein product [Adineta steineri]CAF3753670.1 unnamed protein product [Adineta steineri]
MEATEEELIYLKELVNLRTKQRVPIPIKEQGYISPTMVIDNFLYHGDLNHARNKKLLKELDIRHIINICDYELEKDILDQFNVLWIDADDDISTNINQYFQKTNQFLQSCKEKDEKVLVHCQMGISRSSSIVLAYLMKYHHDSLSQAYDYLIERRRYAAPNAGFFLQLIRYEKTLKKMKEIVDNEQNSVVSSNVTDKLVVDNNISLDK